MVNKESHIFKYFFFALSILVTGCGNNTSEQDRLLPLPNAQNLNPEKRINFLTALINEEDLAELRFERASLYLAVNRNPAALRDIDRAIASDKNNPAYYVIKAKAEFGEGNIEDAMDAALYALEKGVNTSALNLLLGELHYEKDNDVDALRYLQKVLVANPKNYDATYLCGKIYADQSDTAASFLYMDKALKIAPDRKKTYNTYLGLLNQFSLYERAEKIAQAYLEVAEPDAAFSYYLGEILENNKKLDSAMVWFEKSFTQQSHWKPGIKLARYRMKQGDFREAHRLFEQALQQNPAIENGYYELGYLNEYLLGSLDNALNAYENGLAYDTLNNRYPYYINRVKRKIEFQNL